MLTLSFLKDPRYKAITQDFIELIQQKAAMKENHTDINYMSEQIEKGKAAIRRSQENFLQRRREEIEKRAEEIETAYKNHKERYEDPEQELLKRQDFEMKVALMDAYEASELIRDKQVTLTPYELRYLANRFKNNTNIVATVKTMLKGETDVERDPEYKELKTEFQELSLLLNDAIYFVEETSEGYASKGYGRISLNDFTASSLDIYGAGYFMDALKESQRLLARSSFEPKEESTEEKLKNYMKRTENDVYK